MNKAIECIEAGKKYEDVAVKELTRTWRLKRIFRKVIESSVDTAVGGMLVRISIPQGGKYI